MGRVDMRAMLENFWHIIRRMNVYGIRTRLLCHLHVPLARLHCWACRPRTAAATRERFGREIKNGLRNYMRWIGSSVSRDSCFFLHIVTVWVMYSVPHGITYVCIFMGLYANW